MHEFCQNAIRFKVLYSGFIKTVFRLYICKNSAVYLSVYRVKFKMQDTRIEFHDYVLFISAFYCLDRYFFLPLCAYAHWVLMDIWLARDTMTVLYM